MKTMLLPLTLLVVLSACGEDPHIKEIEGLRGIIAQNDIDKKAAAKETGILREDYELAKMERDACWARGNELGVFVLEYIRAKDLKADVLYVCHQSSSDANGGNPRSPWITTEYTTECEDPTEFRFVYDAAGNPSFAPSED